MHRPDPGRAGDAAGVAAERQILRLGGVFAMLGGAGYMAATLWHGDMPDATTKIALRHIAARPEWPLIHLAGIVSVLLWVGAFAALAHSLPAGLGGFLGRLAVPAVTIGAAVFIVDYSIDGYAAKEAADAWAAASGAEKEVRLRVAEAVLSPLGGTFRSFIAWLYGLPYLLLGLAVALSGQYPRWLGWVAATAGAGAVFTGTTLFLELNLVPMPVLFGAFVIPLNIWLAVVGVLMWRRGGSGTRLERGPGQLR
ncbi:MAG: hypothetical protein ACREK1_09235, partial [Longimicrobiales bacterium]